MAMHMYATNSHGYLPRCAGNGLQQPEDFVYWQQDRQQTEPLRDSPLVKYLGSEAMLRRILLCPNDDPAIRSRQNRPEDGPYPFSYSMNATLGVATEYYSDFRCTKLSQIRNSSEVVMLMDESSDTIDDGLGIFLPLRGGDNVVSDRHDRTVVAISSSEFPGVPLPKRKGNVAMADGSVQFAARGYVQNLSRIYGRSGADSGQ